MEQTVEPCYQCGDTSCMGVALEYCPKTNVYHDASDKALAEMYPSPGPEASYPVALVPQSDYDALLAERDLLLQQVEEVKQEKDVALLLRDAAQAQLARMASDIPSWGMYEHYKGGRYKVLATMKFEADGRDAIAYMNTETNQQYARPLDEFFQEVAPGIPRFKAVLPVATPQKEEKP